MKERIAKLADFYFGKVQEIYHFLHQHPELSGEEKETSEYVCKILDSLGIPYSKGVAGYGVVALIEGGGGDGKTVALRADMDALPIQEATNLPFSSVVQGVMHACGHDIHTASLLGALMILKKLQPCLKGRVKAIFQPSEESYNGGAPFMIEAGVLENPRVDIIIGQHVTPGLEAGTVGFHSGPFMASTDEVHIVVTGKPGHAARPEETINPIYAAAELVDQLRNFVVEKRPQDTPTILSFGKFVANGSTNIVPETAVLAGTFRTFDERWRGEFHTAAACLAKRCAEKHNTDIECKILKGYPVLTNDPTVTEFARSESVCFLGEKNVCNMPVRLTAEDFAYYLQQCPGVFYRLGVSNKEKGIIQTTHSADFKIDENALKTSIGLLGYLAFQATKNCNIQ